MIPKLYMTCQFWSSPINHASWWVWLLRVEFALRNVSASWEDNSEYISIPVEITCELLGSIYQEPEHSPLGEDSATYSNDWKCSQLCNPPKQLSWGFNENLGLVIWVRISLARCHVYCAECSGEQGNEIWCTLIHSPFLYSTIGSPYIDCTMQRTDGS